MNFVIRQIDKTSIEELETVTRLCMTAVLETIPEFEGNAAKAREYLSNFSFEQMKDMISADLEDPDKRIMVAVITNTIAGQALYSVKYDPQGLRYGFCFSRYVMPEYRRAGIAAKLLEGALEWFGSRGAEYVIAQTHVTNIPLQRLFQRFGFTMSEQRSGAWKYFELKKDLVRS